jgi:hypothetical protein
MKPIYKLTKSQLLAENATLGAEVERLRAEMAEMVKPTFELPYKPYFIECDLPRRWWEFWK